MGSKNITYEATKITQDERAKLKGQNPCVIWLTGLSGSGKSTLANALEKELFKRGYHTFLLDGDNLRYGLTKDLGFDKESRIENIRRVSEVAKLFVESGLVIIVALISPFIKDREFARSLFKKEGEFIEVFVNTPLEVCESRDAKGLYKKARAGEIEEFTGITSPYEKPLNPELTLDNSQNLQENVALVLEFFLKMQNN